MTAARLPEVIVLNPSLMDELRYKKRDEEEPAGKRKPEVEGAEEEEEEAEYDYFGITFFAPANVVVPIVLELQSASIMSM